MNQRFHNQISLLMVLVIALAPLNLAFAKSFNISAVLNEAQLVSTHQLVSHFASHINNNINDERSDIDAASSLHAGHDKHECNDCDNCGHCVAVIINTAASHLALETTEFNRHKTGVYHISLYPDQKPPRLS
jgi:ABC-type maltose transport system permease subunit